MRPWPPRIISALRPLNWANCSGACALDSFSPPGDRACARETRQRRETVPQTFRVNAGKQELDLEVVEGTEGERGIDISSRRAKTGLVTIDPAVRNTASSKS